MCYGLLCGSVYVTRGGGFQRRKPLKLRVCKGKKKLWGGWAIDSRRNFAEKLFIGDELQI